MEDGLQILTTSRAALAAATANNDLSRMGQAAADMRAGVAQYESGLAAFRALEDSESPGEFALSWFKREMNLDSSAQTKPDAVGFGMTLFHATLCLFLLLFASAIVWMYVLRMPAGSSIAPPPVPSARILGC